MIIIQDTLNVSLYVYIIYSLLGTSPGEPVIALTHADITAGSYIRQGGLRTSIGTLSTLAAADSAHSDGGFKEVDATNMPGVYRIDVADAAFASGVDSVVIQLKMTAEFIATPKEIEIRSTIDSDVTEIKVVADAQARSAASIVDGTAATGTLSLTEMTTNLTIAVVDQYKSRIIIFATDTATIALRGQATDITAVAIANGKLTFTALTTIPANGDTFSIV